MFKIELLEEQIYSMEERLSAVNNEIQKLQKYLENSTLSIQLEGVDIKSEFQDSINKLSSAIDLEHQSFIERLMNETESDRRTVMIGLKNYALGNGLIDENEDTFDSSKSLEQVVEEHCKEAKENLERLKVLILSKKV